jgi:hypothetical protein
LSVGGGIEDMDWKWKFRVMYHLKDQFVYFEESPLLHPYLDACEVSNDPTSRIRYETRIGINPSYIVKCLEASFSYLLRFLNITYQSNTGRRDDRRRVVNLIEYGKRLEVT